MAVWHFKSITHKSLHVCMCANVRRENNCVITFCSICLCICQETPSTYTSQDLLPCYCIYSIKAMVDIVAGVLSQWKLKEVFECWIKKEKIKGRDTLLHLMCSKQALQFFLLTLKCLSLLLHAGTAQTEKVPKMRY